MDDPYTLSAHLGELVFSELGWRARFFGNGLPVDTVAQAVRDLHPRAYGSVFRLSRTRIILLRTISASMKRAATSNAPLRSGGARFPNRYARESNTPPSVILCSTCVPLLRVCIGILDADGLVLLRRKKPPGSHPVAFFGKVNAELANG